MVNLCNQRIDDFFFHLARAEYWLFKRLLPVKQEHQITHHPRGRNPSPQVLISSSRSQIEWWYFTGFLEAKQKQYAYEVTFFKRAANDLRLGFLPLIWFRNEPLMSVHFTLTDLQKKSFTIRQWKNFFSKDEAIISNNKLFLSLGPCQLGGETKLRLQAGDRKLGIDLHLDIRKPLVAHGKKGVSIKLEDPKHVSYYVSYPRLAVDGTLTLDGNKIPVHGTSWMDHEKTYSPPLSPLRGWDWCYVQFEDQTEIVLYRIRIRNQQIKLSGTYVDRNGKTTILISFTMQPLSFWKSKTTGAELPIAWKIDVPSLSLSITIQAMVEDQEVVSTSSTVLTYWEGAITAAGSKRGKKISGRGFLELVGYDQRLLPRILLYQMS